MSDQETDNEDDPMRAFVRQIFAPHDEPDESEPDEQQKPPGNFVAREGNISQPVDHDADMRAFARELFDRDPS